MNIPSFVSYFENRLNGLPSQRSMQTEENGSVAPIGGFFPISGVQNGLVFGESAYSEARREKSLQKIDPSYDAGEHTSITRTPVLFDKYDRAFLYQFMPGKWKVALKWRYGEGLRMAAKAILGGKKIPQQTTINFGTAIRGGDEEYNVNTYLEPLWLKLTKDVKRSDEPGSNGLAPDSGLYGFNLLGDWYEREVNLASGPEKQLFVRGNYKPMVLDTAAKALTNWREGTIQGLVGDYHKINWGKAEDEDAPKKRGRTSQQILPARNGQFILTSSKIAPIYTPQQMMEDGIIEDHSRLDRSEPDRAKLAIKYRSRGQDVVRHIDAVEMLPDGRMFSQKQLKKYKTGLDHLEEIITPAMFEMFEGATFIDPQDIKKMLPPDQIEQFNKTIEAFHTSLPNSGHPDAMTPITERQHIESVYSGTHSIGTVPFGRTVPGRTTKSEIPVDPLFLAKYKVSRSDFEAFIEKHFTGRGAKAGGSQGFYVKNGAGKLVESPIISAVRESIESRNEKQDERQAEALRAEYPFIIDAMRGRIQKLNGHSSFRDFYITFNNPNATPDEKQRAWEICEKYIKPKCSTFVGDVNQLALNSEIGTRRHRESKKNSKIVALGDKGIDDLDNLKKANDAGSSNGKQGIKKGILQARVNDADSEERYSWLGNVRNTNKHVQDLMTMKKDNEMDVPNAPSDAEIIGHESKIRSQVIHSIFLSEIKQQLRLVRGATKTFQDVKDKLNWDKAWKNAIKRGNFSLHKNGVKTFVYTGRPLTNQEKEDAFNDLEDPEKVESAEHIEDRIPDAENVPDVWLTGAPEEKAPEGPHAPAAAHPEAARRFSSSIFVPALKAATPEVREHLFNSPQFVNKLISDPKELDYAKRVGVIMYNKSEALKKSIAHAEEMIRQGKTGT